MATGPIPWNVIVEYAAFHQLDYDLVDAFIKIISAMDKAYLKRLESKQKPKTPKGKS